jgi:hypothetical protein
VLAVPDHDCAQAACEAHRSATGCPAGGREGRAGGWSSAEAEGRDEGRSCAAERARGAAERLTGLPVRVSAGKLEITSAEEVRLEELVEVLEKLVATIGVRSTSTCAGD